METDKRYIAWTRRLGWGYRERQPIICGGGNIPYRAEIPWRDLPPRFGDEKWCIPDLAVDQQRGYGKKSSRSLAQMRITNMS